MGAMSAAFGVSPACAQSGRIDGADTAWMIVATSIVLMMTIPGLALFYAGMVRKKNVLATMAQSLAATALISILWVAFGYSLVFTGDGALIGSSSRLFLDGMGMDSINPLAKTIPEALFMLYQMAFAVITVALVVGSVADRMRFSAFLLFSALGWLSSMYRLRTGSGAAASSVLPACWTLPAAPWCTSTRALPGSPPRCCWGRDAATVPKISRRSIFRWRSWAPACCGSDGSASMAVLPWPPIHAPSWRSRQPIWRLVPAS
jgi:hypothetical protein